MENNIWDVVVIGGGPAGMIVAGSAFGVVFRPCL
jgi:predicted flavoprotein YhiN